MKAINWIMEKFLGWYIRHIVDATIERCANVCEMNHYTAEEMYWSLREIASYPDSDMGVLKYACYSGQAARDADNIRKLKSV